MVRAAPAGGLPAEGGMTGRCLPADWTPSLTDQGYGLNLGLSLPQVLDCAEEMRLWAGANANRAVARKLDWGMAFKSWMRRAKQQKEKPPNGAGSATMDAFDKLIRRWPSGGPGDHEGPDTRPHRNGRRNWASNWSGSGHMQTRRTQEPIHCRSQRPLRNTRSVLPRNAAIHKRAWRGLANFRPQWRALSNGVSE